MPQTAHTWRSIINDVKRAYSSVNPQSFKFKQLVIAQSENLTLFPQDIVDLGLHLGMKLFPRPKGIGQDWKYSLCKSYLSQRYTNPKNPCEYTVVVPPGNKGSLPYVIHRSGQGYADARWFLEVIPELATIISDPAVGRPFSMNFNSELNKFFETRNHGKGMTPGQIQALNLFFEKYVPGIEGICTSCFKVSLPISGAGERWTLRSDDRYEVRLSAAKPNGKSRQQSEYVSHAEVDQNQELLYALWDPAQCQVRYGHKIVGGQKNEQNIIDSHIPWKVYDFDKLSIGMPRCQCKNKSS